MESPDGFSHVVPWENQVLSQVEPRKARCSLPGASMADPWEMHSLCGVPQHMVHAFVAAMAKVCLV